MYMYIQVYMYNASGFHVTVGTKNCCRDCTQARGYPKLPLSLLVLNHYHPSTRNQQHYMYTCMSATQSTPKETALPLSPLMKRVFKVC